MENIQHKQAMEAADFMMEGLFLLAKTKDSPVRCAIDHTEEGDDIIVWAFPNRTYVICINQDDGGAIMQANYGSRMEVMRVSGSQESCQMADEVLDEVMQKLTILCFPD